MNISDFIYTLIDELDKNSFIGVEIDKAYNKTKKSFVIVVSVAKKGKIYVYSFEIKENELNYNNIENIVNFFINFINKGK